MNIDKIKGNIKNMVGKEVSIKVNVGRNKYENYVGRNKYENYVGKVIDMYPAHFTVKVDELIKSFTYVDVLIRAVTLKVC